MGGDPWPRGRVPVSWLHRVDPQADEIVVLAARPIMKEEQRSELDLCLDGGRTTLSSLCVVIDRSRGRDRHEIVEVVHRELCGERKDAVCDCPPAQIGATGGHLRAAVVRSSHAPLQWSHHRLRDLGRGGCRQRSSATLERRGSGFDQLNERCHERVGLVARQCARQFAVAGDQDSGAVLESCSGVCGEAQILGLDCDLGHRCQFDRGPTCPDGSQGSCTCWLNTYRPRSVVGRPRFSDFERVSSLLTSSPSARKARIPPTVTSVSDRALAMPLERRRSMCRRRRWTRPRRRPCLGSGIPILVRTGLPARPGGGTRPYDGLLLRSRVCKRIAQRAGSRLPAVGRAF